ncbi:MAG: sugar-binding protein [Eubacteriales bacterium]
MKKMLFPILLSALLVCSAIPTFAYSQNASYGSVPQISGELDVDGVMDDAYNYGLKLKINRVLGGELAAQGDAYYVYSDNYLYIYTVVTDSTDCHVDDEVWNADCVEMLFDWDDSNSAVQYRVNSDNVSSGDGDGGIRDFSGASVRTDAGYNVEFRIALDGAAKDSNIGLMMMVTDLYTDGSVDQNNIMLASSLNEGGPWAAETYDYLTLGDVADIPVEVEETAPAAEEAPASDDTAAPSVTAAQTSDASLVSAALLALSAAGAFVFAKKKSR